MILVPKTFLAPMYRLQPCQRTFQRLPPLQHSFPIRPLWTWRCSWLDVECPTRSQGETGGILRQISPRRWTMSKSSMPFFHDKLQVKTCSFWPCTEGCGKLESDNGQLANESIIALM